MTGPGRRIRTNLIKLALRGNGTRPLVLPAPLRAGICSVDAVAGYPSYSTA